MQESLNPLLYKEYTSVSVYPYIPGESDVEFVLLREIKTGNVFAVTGLSASIDACILFTAARSLLRETNGLFTASNLLTNGTEEIKPLTLRKPEHFDCNLILNETEFNGLLKHMTKTAEHVNVSSDSKVIMFPISPIDLKAFNNYLEESRHSCEVITIKASKLKEKEINFVSFTKDHLNAILDNIFMSVPYVINESRRKHYAIISCYDSAFTSMMYDHCEYLLQGQFRRQDETWHYFKVSLDQYPDLSLLEKLDGIVIPGAGGHTYDTNTKWIPKLEEFIRHIYKNTKTRYLGLCFGAQILAQALGGKVESNHQHGFKQATEHITLNDEFYDLPYVKEHKSFYRRRPKKVIAVKSHEDHITKIPDEATLLGSSKTAKTEIFCIGDRFLATQGHPEYSTDFVCSRDSALRISEATDSDVEEYEEKKKKRAQKNYSLVEDSYDLRTILANFLKNIV